MFLGRECEVGTGGAGGLISLNALSTSLRCSLCFCSHPPNCSQGSASPHCPDLSALQLVCFQFFSGIYLPCRIFLLPKHPAVFYYYFFQVNCHRFPFLGQCVSGRSLTASYLDKWHEPKGQCLSRCCAGCERARWPRQLRHSSCCGKSTLKVTRRFIMHNFFFPRRQ